MTKSLIKIILSTSILLFTNMLYSQTKFYVLNDFPNSNAFSDSIFNTYSIQYVKGTIEELLKNEKTNDSLSKIFGENWNENIENELISNDDWAEFYKKEKEVYWCKSWGSTSTSFYFRSAGLIKEIVFTYSTRKKNQKTKIKLKNLNKKYTIDDVLKKIQCV